MEIKKWLSSELTWYFFQNRIQYSEFSPYLYSLEVVKECFVHQLHNNVKDIKPYRDTNKSIYNLIKEILDMEMAEATPSYIPELNYSCYIYFITVKEKFKRSHTNKIKKFIENKNSSNEDDEKRYVKYEVQGNYTVIEKLVYIGETADLRTRFIDGHKATQLLNDPIYSKSEKRVYFARVSILMNNGILPFFPLEVFSPKELVKNILRLIESTLIPFYGVPEFNSKDKIPKLFLNNKTKYDSAIVQADFININYSSGNSLFFNEEVTVPLPSYLMLAIEKLPKKVFKQSIYKNEAVKAALKKVGITEHLS